MFKPLHCTIALVATLGILLVSSSASLAGEPKLSPIDPPPLDRGRAPSSPLLPWLSRSGLVGFADRAGVLRIAPQFTYARPFYEGFAAVSVDGRHWGFIQPSGAFQIAPRYGMVSDFLDGKARVSELREPVNMPLTQGVLVEGRVTERIIDRRGAQLKERDFGANVLVDWGVSERRFARYPEPSSDQAPGWQEVAVDDRRRGLRRLVDGKLIVRANEVRVIRDIATGNARFLASHDWNQPWSVFDLDGKLIAARLFDVYKYSSEGCFYAGEGPQGWWGAYESDGRRITPDFASSPFVFRDGIAEAEVVQGKTVYVDRKGRMYVDPGYLESLQAPFVRGSNH